MWKGLRVDVESGSVSFQGLPRPRIPETVDELEEVEVESVDDSERVEVEVDPGPYLVKVESLEDLGDLESEDLLLFS